ncbi:prepilin-type N-terminal cleavage/methylation domain-containing protein [Thioalkalivibrio sp.]|uniref:PilW family protein n=1 Tax=Thioalkalivibrio sp. TaxID=2093813 RepID=UPI0025E82AB2|nr:prepilin-type N-terminal cleavage/methylation domain-containing protein [Thioalkalivibrio sp.]
MGSRRLASGLTLVELMIGILIGMILMTAVTSVYIASIRSNTAVLTMAQLNHEVRSVAEVVANDIRRAGFDNVTSTRTLADLQNDYDRIEISSTGDCVRFGYNRSVAALKSFGFRWVEGTNGIGVVEMKVAADDTTCDNWGSSNSAALTDERRVNITDFRLSTSDPSVDSEAQEGSRCFNLALRQYGDQEQALDEWSWLSDDATTLPCDRADLAVLPEASVEKTLGGDLLVEHRQLFLTVTGQANTPAGQAGRDQPLETTITTEIRIPNNRRLLATISPD